MTTTKARPAETVKTIRELTTALRDVRKQYEAACSYGPEEKAEYQRAYQADAKTALAAGKSQEFVMTCGQEGEAQKEHERKWSRRRNQLRTMIATLEWALGKGEFPKVEDNRR